MHALRHNIRKDSGSLKHNMLGTMVEQQPLDNTLANYVLIRHNIRKNSGSLKHNMLGTMVEQQPLDNTLANYVLMLVK